MNIQDYIKGQRKGKEAHRLEKEAMNDPFLSDALEGFDAVQGNHAKRIEELRSKLPRPEKQQTNYMRIAGIAAGILLLVGVGCIAFLYNKSEPGKQLVAQAEQIEEREQIIEFTEPENTIETEIPIAPPPVVQEKKQEPPLLAEETKDVIADELIAEDFSIGDAEMLEEVIIADQRSTDRKENQRIQSVSHESEKISSAHNKKATEISAPIEEYERFNKYVKDSIRYPADSLCKDVKGKVILDFKIDDKGRPYDISVKQPLCPSADKEAIRLINEGPDWEGIPRRVEFIVEF